MDEDYGLVPALASACALLCQRVDGVKRIVPNKAHALLQRVLRMMALVQVDSVLPFEHFWLSSFECR